MHHMEGHEHCHCLDGGKLIVLGGIILANELYFNYSWWLVLGGLLMLKGIIVLVMQGKHMCPCHDKKDKK